MAIRQVNEEWAFTTRKSDRPAVYGGRVIIYFKKLERGWVENQKVPQLIKNKVKEILKDLK